MKENLLKIINHYGVNNQQRKLEEEVFELQEIIRDYEFSKEHFPKQHKICESQFKEHIAEEIADCYVMLEQFRNYYDISLNEVKNIGRQKIKRQIGRIKEENE